MSVAALLCNPDFEMALIGAAPVNATARARLHASATLFALCGPMGSRLFIPARDGFEALDADAIRHHAMSRRLYDPTTAERTPWAQSCSGLLPYAADRRATRLAKELGLPPPPVDEALSRRLNSKAFSHALARDAGLEPGVFAWATLVDSPDALMEHVRRLPDAVAARWTLKPLHGFSGGGRLHGDSRGLPASSRTRLEQHCRRDGAMLFEPWVERTEDFSTQLFIAPSGEVRLLHHLRLWCTESGRYLGNGALVDNGSGTVEALAAAARTTGEALGKEGFMGVAGVDAFAFRDPVDGQIHLRALVEINARFTLGLMAAHVASMGMICQRFVHPGAWRFTLDGAEPLGRWTEDHESFSG